MKRNKRFWYSFYLICGFFLTLREVHAAYVDPSVLTYAIQAIAGILIALGTMFGLYGRKIRRFLFGEEESSERDIRSDDLVFHDPDGTEKRALSFLTEEEIQKTEKEIRKKQRYLSGAAGIWITAAVAVLWMAYSPIMLYLGNTREFRFDFYSILPAVGVMTLTGLLTGWLVYFIARRISPKLYVFLCGLGLAFLVISYIQGSFFSDHLPPLDGRDFDWSLYGPQKLQSLALILCVILIVILLYKKLGRNAFLRLSCMISAVMILIMTVSAVNLGIQKKGFEKKRSASVTQQEIFTMSSEKNVIFFMIDAVDSGLFRELMETEDPEYREYFEDFTYFPNTVGSYTYTSHAVPFILTGQWYENQEEFEVFETRAMNESPLFHTLEEQGYRLGLYEDQLTYEDDGIYRFENVMDDHYRLDSIGEYARQSFFMTWFQYMPYPLKPLLSHEDMFENIQHRDLGTRDPFVGNNIWFYQKMKTDDFTFTEQPVFRFIHLEGAHVPFHFDKEVNEISTEDGSYAQNIQASITIVHAYLEKLKQAGIYEDSAIVVLSDHGFTYLDEVDGLKGRSNPLLLFKGFGESHAMEISEQPLSHVDLQQMYQRLLAGKSSKELSDLSENEPRERRFLGFNFEVEELIYEYVQKGYAHDFDAMEATGEVYRSH